jgi:hypothetical protein
VEDIERYNLKMRDKKKSYHHLTSIACINYYY